MPGSEAVTTAPERRHEQRMGGRDRAGAAGAKPADFNLAEGVMRYLILDPPQPEYDFMTFDYDRDPRARQTLEQAGRREGRRPVQVPQERRQAAS